jgi:hypothetical protein
MRALLWPLFARSDRSQLAIVETGTKCEGSALGCFRSVGVGSASLCGAGTTDKGAFLDSVLLGGMGSASH